MILCIGTTPATQRVMTFRQLTLGSVNRAVTALDGVGGKAVNVAKVLKTLGARPVATGFVGGDRGQQVRALLDARGIDHEFVTVAARTRQCITVIDDSAGTHTELIEEGAPVEASDYGKLLSIIERRIKLCRVVVMSGTLTPGGSSDFYRHCTRLAGEAGVLAAADAQGAALSGTLSARPALVKPNRAELAATLGRELKDEPAVMGAMRELHECGAQRIVVTAGKEPLLAFDGRSYWRITPPRVSAVNSIGSGDAFTAGLIWRLLQGENLGEACRWAAAVGAANALTTMSGEIRFEEVEVLLPQVILTRMVS